jgi:hypothetical protein
VTKPHENIVVECPKCGRVYDDTYRASINLSLGRMKAIHIADANRECRWALSCMGPILRS